jgi:hypothetical protein
MKTTPQKVTSRYARNLLVKGKNNEFHLLSLVRKSSMVDECWIGNYYTAEIVSTHGMRHEAVGPTPENAVNRCLDKHGVTFR